MLTTLDIAVVVGWLALSVGMGVLLTKTASQSFESFFGAKRSLPWWVVGTSMVATTFAADTPLAVSGWVASDGIAKNWVWWTFGLTGMFGVFFFAPMWRRSGVWTDAELVELRYGPGPGTWLRRFKALWFGVFFNALVIAWVVKAMITLTEIMAPAEQTGIAPLLIVGSLFAITVIYTAASGLWGVVVTDLIQFVVAMVASVSLAVIAWVYVGGLSGLQTGFSAHELDWNATVTLLPADGAFDGPLAGFVVLISMIWWSSHNVDGGGYLAQRLFAAKDESHARFAYLWFTVAHMVLRPWPWIVVGLVGMAMFGVPDNPESLYPMVMAELLPAGMLGLMVASFLAAFMSTIDTQLNWGASLVTNDLWLPMARSRGWDLREVTASRLSILGVAILGALTSFALTSIGDAWLLAMSVTAGLGAVYIARWLWWRTNAWSEITAMIVATAGTLAFEALHRAHPGIEPEHGWQALAAIPAAWFKFPFSAAAIVVIGLPIWVLVTLMTKPVAPNVLRIFADRVRPGGPGWPTHLRHPGSLTGAHVLGMISGVICVYAALLGIGWWILGRTPAASGATIVVVLSVVGCIICFRRIMQRERTLGDEHAG